MGPIRDEKQLGKYFEWLVNTRGIARETARDYVNYIQKPLNLNIKHSVYAYRLYYRFKGLEPPKNLKPLKKVKPDLRVPSESEILETIRQIRYEKVRQVYLVLLQSGLRLAHACYLLNNIDDLHIVEFDGYYRVDLNIQRGKKKAWVAYLLEIPRRTDISPNTVSNVAKHLLVKPKYVRKFVITKMHMLDVDSDAVRFMVGHSIVDVHTNSYYNVLAKADKEYSKYAAWLKDFLEAGVA